MHYIEFRHNAVLAFAMKRSHDLASAGKYALKAFGASPTACFGEAFKFFGKAKS